MTLENGSINIKINSVLKSSSQLEGYNLAQTFDCHKYWTPDDIFYFFYQYIFDSPAFHKDFESELELYFGVGGNAKEHGGCRGETIEEGQ